MTETTNATAQALEKLANLQVYVGQGREGIFTAYTESEPFFCFDGNTLEEVEEQVADTLESYARIFYSAEIAVKRRDGAHQVPVERLRPVEIFVPELEAA